MNIISEIKVKTRKDHHCWGCTKLILKGSEVTASTSADGGHAMTTYWCETCDNFLRTLHYWDVEDGFDYGSLKEFENYPVCQ